MFRAFTQKGNGLMPQLITACGISLPFDPQQGGFPQGGPTMFNGLWDTGATGSVIDKTVVSALNLQPVGKTKAYNANGHSEVNVYLVNIYLPNNVAFPMVRVTEGVLNGFHVLIGMDIICNGDFSLTNVGGKTTFSFRIPSIKEIDYVTEEKPSQVPPPTDA